MTNNKDLSDFLAARDVLAANIEMFHAGTRELYRVVAAELRKLTCDGKTTLLSRMFPDIKLHPIRGSQAKMPKRLRESLVFHMPSRIRFDGKGGSRITSLFDANAERIPLEKWCDQPLFNDEITIRQFIRSVSDKESVHSDKNYGDTLLFVKSIKLVSEDIHKQHIVAIGEYILGMMENAIEQHPDDFTIHR